MESLSTTEMVVRELRDGQSDVVFDYLVYGLRQGFEEVSIVQEKRQDSLVPSMEEHLTLYSVHPELRRYNVWERFTAMQRMVDGGVPRDAAGR
ncbi:MAG: hypothetical protein MUE60_09140 [Candidatus Eisenbacteria bacterium]|nr:hypothetical protein [Candidatus Eisenbacteria bacterium]